MVNMLNLLGYVNTTLDKNGISWMIWIWLGVLILSTLIEIFTMDMSSIWFAVAALVAIVLAAIPAVGWEVQLGVFFGIAIVSLLALRPIAKKFLLKKSQEKTNIESFIGRKIKMLTDSNFDTLGSAKVGDVVWSVKDNTGESLFVGEIVEIERIDGNKLIVKKIAVTPTADADKEVTI